MSFPACPLSPAEDGTPAPCQRSIAERLEGQCRIRQITCATCGGAWNEAAAAEDPPLEIPREGPELSPATSPEVDD